MAATRYSSGTVDPVATLGGKGANLVRLRDAGFPVPPFVVLDTSEYEAFVSAHGLRAVIADALSSDAAAASETIRAAFRQPLPDAQRDRIAAAVGVLAEGRVAVRSSATAEDLPEASFAGQQDTFLGVHGVGDVLAAVVECWSSLWTERAITYRARNGVDADAVALAVVVQELVDAEASGVLFTADPLTGHRGHTRVDAVFGLGEALVSGQVTPDAFLVDTASGAVLESTVQGERPTLSGPQLGALVDLGRRVAEHYGAPQDIEWTRVGDTLALVQSRAITSLYPLPEAPGGAVPVWISFGGVQGMLDPITPLGADVLRRMGSGVASVFGGHVDWRANPWFRSAGERLWLRFDDLLRGPVRKVVLTILPIGDPAGVTLLKRLATEPEFAPRGGTYAERALDRARTMRTGGTFGGPVLARAVRTVADPDAARARFDRRCDDFVVEVDERLAAAAVVKRPEQRLAARVRALEFAAERAFPLLLPNFGPIMMPSVALMTRLRALAAETHLPDADALALGVMRALPGNVTTEMDLALYAVARRLSTDAASAALFSGTDPAELAASYLAGTLPGVAQEALAGFLARYGMRGVAEIDLGTPRWREMPEGIMRTVASYLTLDPAAGPDVAHERGRVQAEAAIERLAGALPPVKARVLRVLAGRLRRLFGARETPKFTLIRVLGLVRTALQASGRDLMDAGVLADADDVFFLRFDELHGAFAAGETLRAPVAERRASRARELRRTRIPIMLVGDGRTFYSGVTDPGDADLAGTGVSPGVVEGVARVVDDPRTSELQPGESLVCRGTDPAWTPLFLTASGLITEVGGLMTHGSVVAREYGMPAVVGVAGATETLRPGQRIRLDGTAGTITYL